MHSTQKILVVSFSILWLFSSRAVVADTIKNDSAVFDTLAGDNQKSVGFHQETKAKKNSTPEGLYSGNIPLGHYPYDTSYVGHTFFIGLKYGYMDYKEFLYLEDLKALAEMDGIHIDSFIGTPKSTERGSSIGFSFDYKVLGKNKPVFFQPKCAMVFGLVNEYDGSKQMLDTLSGEIIEIFKPATFEKRNYYFHYGFDLGYLIHAKKLQVYLSSGLQGKTWIRSLIDLDDPPPSGISYTYDERYRWFVFPLNSTFNYVCSRRFAFGGQITVNCMFHGSMKYEMRISNKYHSIGVDAETLKLSNRMGGYISLYIEPFIDQFFYILGVRFEPYFEFYRFGKSAVGTMRLEQDGVILSNSTTHFLEPSSRTFWTGIKLQLTIYRSGKRTFSELEPEFFY